MSKALRTVGLIIGGVALVASGVGLAVGAGFLGATAAGATAATFLGATAATWATIGAVAGVAAAAISYATRPSFTAQGNPQEFQANPQSGLPYAIGRTRMSGVRIHADTASSAGYTKAEDLVFFAILLSAGGLIGGIEKFTADGAEVTFNPSTGVATTPDYSANWMAQKVWTGGAQSSALSLSLMGTSIPNWNANYKLSGISHALWALRYDTDGKKYSSGVPEPAWIVHGVMVYDPRLDSTYPGGSGPCRALDESTYVWSNSPALHALTWCLGRWQNGKRTLGLGAPLSMIRIADFVEAANVGEANAWSVGGVEYSTDSKWQIFKRMLQAGGAVPTMTGAMIGCRVFTPRLSIATITSDDLLDTFNGVATKSRRDRFNTAIPRYRSEAHEWEVISAKPITVPLFVTQDGGVRSKEIDLPLVQADLGVFSHLQAGQLAAYEIVNSREAGPLRWVTGPKFIGLKTGDCVLLDIPEEGFDEQPVILTSVSLDPSTGKISFTAETETDSKHDFALGLTAVPPPPFSLTPPDIAPPAPLSSDWALIPDLGADGLPLLRLNGGGAAALYDQILIQYRAAGGDWTSWGTVNGAPVLYIVIPGVDGVTEYRARLAYVSDGMVGPWLELGPVSTDAAGLLSGGNVALGGNVLANSHFRNGLSNWIIYNDGTFYGGDAATISITDERAIRLETRNIAGDVIGSIGPWDGGAIRFDGRRVFRILPGQRIAWRAKGRVEGVVVRSTPTFRLLAKDASTIIAFTRLSEAFSGHPVEIVAGEEEAAGFYDVPDDPAIYWLEVEYYGYAASFEETGPGAIEFDALLLAAITSDQTVPPVWSEGQSAYGQGYDGIVAESTGPIAYAVPCSYDATPHPGALDAAAGTMHLRDARLGLLTSGVTGFIVQSATNCGAVIDGTTGAYYFTAITDNYATATFGCIYNGRTYTLTVSLNKVRDGKSSNVEADGASVSGISSFSYPSPDNEHADIDIIVPDGQTLTISGRFDYNVDPSNTGTFDGKAKVTYQNVSTFGAETDLAALAGSTSSRFFIPTDEWGGGYFETAPGVCTLGGTITNSSGSAHLYRLRIYVAKYSGTATASGNVSISGSTS